MSRPFSLRHAAALFALIALSVVALALNVRRATVMVNQLHMNDFGKFYYSARGFLDGGDMYAPSPATDLGLDKARGLQFLNMNPPHFHLIVLPLARLQPAQAIAIWMGVSVFALALSMLLILRELKLEWTESGLLSTILATLTFSGTQAFFVTGQSTMFLLLAMTICWILARHGRWLHSCVWLGVCLSIKPFLLIVVPYLIGTRRFRALFVTLTTCAGCFVIGVLIFGFDAYTSWYRALGQSGDWAWTVMNASFFGWLRRSLDETGFLAPLALRPDFVGLWILPAGLVGVITLWVTMRDKTDTAVDRAFALMLVAAQLISPLGWVYYLWLPAGPVAALVLRPVRRPRRLMNESAAWVAAIGFVCPLETMFLFQPYPWATVTFASVYFWATLALWLRLLADYAAENR